MVAKATTQGAPEPRIVLSNIEWETYERLLADQADSSAPRFAYDRGALEIMSPLPEHERYNRTIAALVESVAEELGLDGENLGSTTFKREDLERGFEPDSCFYIQHEAAVRGKSALDLRVDPPPDLVIAIDITHPSLDKFPIYAALIHASPRRHRLHTCVCCSKHRLLLPTRRRPQCPIRDHPL